MLKSFVVGMLRCNRKSKAMQTLRTKGFPWSVISILFLEILIKLWPRYNR